MAQGKSIFSLAFLLLIIIVVIGVVYTVYGDQNYTHSKWDKDVEVAKSNDVEFVEVVGERQVSENVVLIHDKFVGTYDKDANIIVIDSSGNAYNFKSGVVLADSSVMRSNDEEHSVRRLDNERKSVSSN